MKASETKFRAIVEGTKQYLVPLFQRPYSWEKKEWEVLWNDLLWLCENEEPKSHFIGSIVTIPATSVPEGVAKYLLIDGQQRITTLYILLACLRDVARAGNIGNLADRIHKTMLVNEFEDGFDAYKLLPTQADRDAFIALISQIGNPGSSRVAECYEYFARKLKQGKADPVVLHFVISSRLSIVSIVLDRDDNPHLVFESLNAKGRPLTQSDLIRNYFFMRFRVEEQQRIHDRYWKPMQDALGDGLTESIRHYLMRNGSIVKQSDVYFTIKDRIGDTDVLQAMESISTFAGYYQHLTIPQTEPDPYLRDDLMRLNRLEVTTAYPFLLNCYDDYAQSRISSAELHQILRMVESYIIRRFVCNIPTSQLNKMFPALYHQAHEASPSSLVEGVRLILQTRGYPKDAEFQARLIDSKLYGAGERGIKTKFILESIEMSFGHREQITFDRDITIEHIMPQTLTAWWESHLGEEWQVTHELYLHTIGNLTLTGYNSELSNKPFPHKRNEYLNSHLELNRAFENTEHWDRDAIETRSQQLAAIAAEAVWPYFGDTRSNGHVSAESVTGRTPQMINILGQQAEVSSWREVQTYTLEKLAELDPERFTELAEAYPRFISSASTRFRRHRQLSNGYYIEINLAAREVYRFCTQAVTFVGLSSEDWAVETQ